MHKQLVVYCIMFILLLHVSFAAYADLQITVDQTGATTIEGTTNADILAQASQLYTSKNQKEWTINISNDQFFETLVYELRLPEHAAISYMKSSVSARILSEDSSPLIIGVGRNDTLGIVVQYTIESDLDSSNSDTKVFWIMGLVIICIGLWLIIKPLSLIGDKFAKKHPNHKFNSLPERQKLIMLILQQKGAMTMKELNTHIEIPKSSLSRNIDSLQQQNYLVKKPYGMSTRIEIVKKEKTEKQS